MTLDELVVELSQHGIYLTVSHGSEVVLDAPCNGLSEDLVGELERHRSAITSHLIQKTARSLVEQTVVRVATAGRDYQSTPKAEASWCEVELGIERACKANDLQALRLALRDYEAFAFAEFANRSCSKKSFS